MLHGVDQGLDAVPGDVEYFDAPAEFPVTIAHVLPEPPGGGAVPVHDLGFVGQMPPGSLDPVGHSLKVRRDIRRYRHTGSLATSAPQVLNAASTPFGSPSILPGGRHILGAG